MIAILLCAFFFFLTLTIVSFRKSYILRDFTHVIRGKVREVTSVDEGVFLIIEYPVGEQTATYKHRFSPVKLTENKHNVVIAKYFQTTFYLLGKKENDVLIEVTSYSNVKLAKWLYLLGSLIVGYFLFF